MDGKTLTLAEFATRLAKANLFGEQELSDGVARRLTKLAGKAPQLTLEGMYAGWFQLYFLLNRDNPHSNAYETLWEFASLLNVPIVGTEIAIQNWELLAGIEGDYEHDVFAVELELLKHN